MPRLQSRGSRNWSWYVVEGALPLCADFLRRVRGKTNLEWKKTEMNLSYAIHFTFAAPAPRPRTRAGISFGAFLERTLPCPFKWPGLQGVVTHRAQ